jgi:hypothetical protein
MVLSSFAFGAVQCCSPARFLNIICCLHFQISGAYFRTDPRKDVLERIRETMEEIGNSISLTTITTTVAFCLGCISSIPSIRWLCLYAFPTIFIDFIYQVTFFIAILVLDEQRIQANRRDCCICFVVKEVDEEEATSAPSPLPRDREGDFATGSVCSSADTHSQSMSDKYTSSKESPKRLKGTDDLPPLVDRFMDWYAKQLLRPAVKLFVLVFFTAFFVGCIFSATKLKQAFKPHDFLPDDSYALSFLHGVESYTEGTLRIPIYFRFVDQSDDEIQDQMMDYIADLVALPQFGKDPEACWVKDFRALQKGDNEYFEQYQYIFQGNFTFQQKLDIALTVPEIKDLYGGDIARDADGNIETSRCWITIQDLDTTIVKEQIAVLADMESVAAQQPVNQGRSPRAFFTYDPIFFLVSLSDNLGYGVFVIPCAIS